eukprot:SAG11_NODE_3431_length_2451_cov_1.535714_1_plen_158_part_10
MSDAADAGTAPPAVLPIARDLAAAWVAVVGTCDQALTIEGRRRRLSPKARLALGEWMVVTQRRVANLRAMPDKAQKACSAPYLYMAEYHVDQSIGAAEVNRRRIFTACHGHKQGLWISAIPWPSDGRFNFRNPSYRAKVARRYRFRLPPIVQPPNSCP